MGRRPGAVGVDRFNRVHEVDNVLVADGSSFTSVSEKNPLLPAPALAWGAGGYLAGAPRGGRR